MRKALIILFLCITYALNATTYYVATTGSDNNPGTITQPFASWQYAFNKLNAGDILYVRGGTYTAMGSASNGVYIGGIYGSSSGWRTVLAYPGEASPILNCAGLTATSGDKTGLYIASCSYWRIQGLTFINVSEPSGGGSPGPGCQISGSSYITLEQVTVRDCDNGFTCHAGSNEIHYINCDSYQNADHFNGGDLANGFWTRVTSGGKIYYEGCRAWNNSDDGWDAYGAGSSIHGGNGYIYYNNCWAFYNGMWNPGTGNIYGNGAGFKTGATDMTSGVSGVQRRLTNCISASNIGLSQGSEGSSGFGYDDSFDGLTDVPHAIYNCIAYNNGQVGFNIRGTSGNDIFANNISWSNNGLHGQDYFTGNEGSTFNANSWQVSTTTDADFVSLNVDQLKSARKADGSLPDITAFHLVAGSSLIDKGTEVGLPFSGKSPDLGAFEVQSGTAAATVPVYVSSVVENATPSLLEMSFDINLNNLIVPAASSFSVSVNSVNRTVSSVTISGKKVQLTLSSAIKTADAVLVSYTKPATSPLQTAAGGIVATISVKAVTNNCVSNLPVYSSSVVENATPTSLEITYSISLANIIPAKSAFIVQVNTIAIALNSVTISGNKVQITLANPVKYGDLITISYTKPAVNPLQSADGGQALSFSNQLTVNKLAKPVLTPGLKMNVFPNPVHQIVNITFEYGSEFSSLDPSSTSQIIRIFDLSGKLYLEKLIEPGILTVQIPVNLKPGIYIVFVLAGNLEMNSQKIMVY